MTQKVFLAFPHSVVSLTLLEAGSEHAVGLLCDCWSVLPTTTKLPLLNILFQICTLHCVQSYQVWYFPYCWILQYSSQFSQVKLYTKGNAASFFIPGTFVVSWLLHELIPGHYLALKLITYNQNFHPPKLSQQNSVWTCAPPSPFLIHYAFSMKYIFHGWEEPQQEDTFPLYSVSG